MRKHIIERMLEGYYLLSWKNNNGTSCYRLYDSIGNPERNVRRATVKKLDQYIDPKIKIWKTDKAGKITLNLSSVRKLNGRNMIKKLYKQSKQHT